MAARGVRTVIECGPGKVLNGLTRRIDGTLAGFAITDPATLEEALGGVQS
jgi:[acyl-carrier-protein] S-malonyltransferase